MTDAQQKQLEEHARSDLPPALAGGPWLAHHVRMTYELFEKAREREPSLSLHDFLALPKLPQRSKRRGR